MSLVKRLSVATGFSQHNVTRILLTASHRYKSYWIPKRNGSGGRLIEQPSPEVKLCQRWVVKNILSSLPRHDSVTAYERGSSIRLNAHRHCGQKYLLKMDFQDFFPSIHAQDLLQHLQKYDKSGLDERDRELLCLLLFRKSSGMLRLTIGAPSSPLLANTIPFDLDTIISDACSSLGVTYTRYADDLSFSSHAVQSLVEMRSSMQGILQRIRYPRLTINEAKTILVGARYRQTVTGLVLTTTGQVSMGRDRKRMISAMLHYFTLGRLDPAEVSKLRGFVAFAWSIEPDFVRRMADKYGIARVAELLPSALKTGE